MNESESKDLSATKRVSARRASTESDLPAADHTGTIAKRVHARRANPEPEPGHAVEATPGTSLPVTTHEGITLSAQPATAGEGSASVADRGVQGAEGLTPSAEPLTGDGLDFGAASAERVTSGDGIPEKSADRVSTGEVAAASAASTPSSVPPARARARRPRAKQPTKTSAATQQPTAAELAHATQPTAAFQARSTAALNASHQQPSAARIPSHDEPASRATDDSQRAPSAPQTAASRASENVQRSEAMPRADASRATDDSQRAPSAPQTAASRASENVQRSEAMPRADASESQRGESMPQAAVASSKAAQASAFVPRSAAQAAGASHGRREAPPDLSAHDGPTGIVEAARWAASLQPDEELPPSLDHADFADDFGLDAEYETKLRPWLDSLCERHFHVELHGAENIPAHGRALLVANHSRASVWDGIVLRAALRLHHPSGRMSRWLVDDQQFHAPFLGTIVNKLGAVRACQENAERLLLREELVAVFPEGSKATGRPYEERYRLQRFGRGGYVKLALRTGTPVFPVAIVATEHEGAVWRNRLANASRVLSAPFTALRPGFTRIGTLGVPPISARIRIYVGASIAEISRHDASVTQDDGLVHELNECVRSAVQNLVNASLHA